MTNAIEDQKDYRPWWCWQRQIGAVAFIAFLLMLALSLIWEFGR